MLAGQRGVNVRKEERLQRPGGRGPRKAGVRRRVGRQVVEQDGEPSGREPAAVVVREVDAVEAEQIGFNGVAVVAE